LEKVKCIDFSNLYDVLNQESNVYIFFKALNTWYLDLKMMAILDVKRRLFWTKF